MRLAAFAVGYVVRNVPYGLLDPNRNIGTGVSFYGPGACMCASFWSIRNAGGSLYEPGVRFARAVFRHTLMVEADAAGMAKASGNG